MQILFLYKRKKMIEKRLKSQVKRARVADSF